MGHEAKVTMTHISWSSYFCLISWRLFDIWTPYFRIMRQYDTTFNLKINVGRCDLYFMVQWFCLISWRLFDVWTSYFRIMSQYDPTFHPKINVGHCDLYFMVQWFCLISWRLFDIWTPYLGIMSQYDPIFDLKINVGHCDLYFMVQWFCLTSQRLFAASNTILQDYDQYDIFDLKINVGHSWRLIWYMNTILWDCFDFCFTAFQHIWGHFARSVTLTTLFLGKPPRQFTST